MRRLRRRYLSRLCPCSTASTASLDPSGVKHRRDQRPEDPDRVLARLQAAVCEITAEVVRRDCSSPRVPRARPSDCICSRRRRGPSSSDLQPAPGRHPRRTCGRAASACTEQSRETTAASRLLAVSATGGERPDQSLREIAAHVPWRGFLRGKASASSQNVVQRSHGRSVRCAAAP